MVGAMKCGSCGGSDFDGDQLELGTGYHTVYAVYCAGCGVIAGVLEPSQLGEQLREMKEEVAKLRASVQGVAYQVHGIATTLERK